MDKAIEKTVKELKEIARKLYDDDDMTLATYGHVTAELERTRQLLLAADVSYDLKHEKVKA